MLFFLFFQTWIILFQPMHGETNILKPTLHEKQEPENQISQPDI